MHISINSLGADFTSQFDTVIDVRSPSEFAEDHIPGAVNLPVLSDAERAEVGRIYVQESPFRARKIGAALVARNASHHLEGPLSGKEGGWRPLIYCWRGGQRSGSFASILSQIGWPVALLEGGYRSYRRLVVRALYDGAPQGNLWLIDGPTGTAKTQILGRYAKLGGQVLDLEALAGHRGSLFGATGVPQPSQKAFEGALARAMADLDPARPVLVEAESSKIGDRLLPPALWQAMKHAPRIVISAPLDARAAYLVRGYADLTSDREALCQTIARLGPFYAAERISNWQALARSASFEALAAELIGAHYDRRYRKTAARPAVEFALSDLTPDEISGAAERIAAFLAAPDRAVPMRALEL